MKILFAADEQPYSAYALTEVSRLALNTWADVTIVGVTAAGPPRELEVEPDQPLLQRPAPLPGGLPAKRRGRTVALCPGQLSL